MKYVVCLLVCCFSSFSLAETENEHKNAVISHLESQGFEVLGVTFDQNSYRNQVATFADTAGPSVLGGDFHVFHSSLSIQLDKGQPIVCDRASIFVNRKTSAVTRVEISGCSL